MHDADILEEISALLRSSACLHHALRELIVEEQAAAAQSSAVRTALSAQLRVHCAKLGALSNICDSDRITPSYYSEALQALANADHAKALHYIELCDADALRLIERSCRVDGVSPGTKRLLRLLHSVLLQLSLNPIAKNFDQSQP
ncbi:MAG: hypothetical protein AB7O04_14045 [Hyphomonadaceae bacterium]